MSNDEFDALLNEESDSNYIQPEWKLSKRETQFVPTYDDEEEEEVYMKVYDNKQDTPPVKFRKNNKMNTIKEDREGEQSDGSDTAYFGPEDTHDFNNRDDDDDYEEEDKEFEQRYQQMNNEELDDEDHQPYSDGEEDFNEDEEEEKRRI